MDIDIWDQFLLCITYRSLRRHGIGNNDVVIMSPTAPMGWTWHPLNYYYEKLINDIISEILLAGKTLLVPMYCF